MELLTNKQIIILKLLAQNKTCKEIANQLGQSIKNVQIHRRKIYKKLQLSNTLELTRFAIRTGIISLGN